MKLVRTINSWTCLPAAVATHFLWGQMKPLRVVFHELGHDGSEIVRDGEDPFCRRGFHPQEFYELCFRLGYCTTQIDLYPASQPNLKSEFCTFERILGEGCEQRFFRHLSNSFGWIYCRTRSGTGHALAYENATLGDPATGLIFDCQSLQDAESRGFYLVSLFRLDSMRGESQC